MAIAALAAWVLTAGIGGYMLRAWVVRGGLRRQRATGVGAPPAVVFGHAATALTGLALWLAFVRTRWDPLAWLCVALMAGAIALGISTVTLWTPYPVAGAEGTGPPPAGRAGPGATAPLEGATVTDEMIAGLLADPFPAPRRPRYTLGPLVPAAHGVSALTTFMLVVLTAIGAH